VVNRDSLRRALIVGVVYATFAQLSFLMSHSLSLGVSVFPAAGVSVVGLLLSPRRAWPVMVAAIFLAEAAIDTAHHAELLVTLGFALANTIEPFLSASLVLRIGGEPFSLQRVRSVTTLAVVAITMPMLSGLIAGSTVSLAGTGAFWPKWRLWWAQDLVGGLAGAVVLTAREFRPQLSLGRMAQVVGVVIGVGITIFWFGGDRAPIAFLLGIVLVWTAVRLGSIGVSAAGLMVAVAGEWSAWRGVGPFSGASSPHGRIVLTQVFVGACLLTVMIMHAVLAQRRQADQQRAVVEAIGRVAGGVAHDVNNLVHVILMNCEMIFDQIGVESPLWPGIERIARAAEKSAEVAGQLQIVSRLDGSGEPMCDLNHVIGEMAPILQSAIGPVDLEVFSAPLPCPVAAEPAAVEQVLLNLVLNAGEACATGGRVSVHAAFDRDSSGAVDQCAFAELRVMDTGKGMGQELLARALEPWFSTSRGKARGLGLANVRAIVEGYGGTLSMVSEVGTGTTATVRLPIATCEMADAGPWPAAEPYPEQTITVLIVGPNNDARRAMRDPLRGAGYTVLEAAHGGEALERSRAYAQRIDVLIADMMMPGLTGPTLAARLSVERPCLRILLITDLPANTDCDYSSLAPTELLARRFVGDDLMNKVSGLLEPPQCSMDPSLHVCPARQACGRVRDRIDTPADVP
jgi:signal transduction histidine kinase/CheY-like chemotaxis protein